MQSAAPAGSVVTQWPAAGSMLFVRALARYVARLSLATPAPPNPVPQAATVPDLAGLTLDEARGLLEKTRLRPGNVTRVPGEAAAETVVGQAPPASTSLDPGSGVDIQLSTGPQAVALPDLVGKTVAEALAALAGLPLRIVRVDSVPTSAGNGTVVRQSPPAGSQVPPGTGISLVLGVATSPVAATVPVPPGPASPPAWPARPLPWAIILTVVVLALAAAQGLWRWRKRPPVVAPPSTSVELSTTWDFGKTSLEVEGPLEAGPALHLVAHGNLQERVVALEHDQPFVAGGDHE